MGKNLFNKKKFIVRYQIDINTLDNYIEVIE